MQGPSAAVTRARKCLADLRGRPLDERALRAATTQVAQALLEGAAQTQTRSERKRAALLARLMEDPQGQVFTTSLTDRVYRSSSPERIVDVARYLLRRLGTPRYLPAVARVQMQALLRAGPFVPERAARGLLAGLRDETRHVVIAADAVELTRHLSRRRAEGVRVNVNYLGEAVLGEREAQQRLRDYVQLLQRPDIEAISVKLSSIASRVDLLSHRATLDELRPRLRTIYEAALSNLYERPDGTRVPKLVSLDMEAYRDLRLTFELFTSLLAEPGLQALPAGLVLQAYLPDALPLQRELHAFARDRVQAGGAPLRLRLVKGANLAAERLESSQRGWPLPIYGGKTQVDANYKRMLELGARRENAAVVHLGIASHNVFDLAFGLVQRSMHQTESQLGFELLEGMADPLRRTLQALCEDVLVYCPVVPAGSMQTAIAYLMRRLDENTAPENFLRNSFGMRAGDAAWQRELARFEAACELRSTLASEPLRVQDRDLHPVPRTAVSDAFCNEADTDFALAQTRAWIKRSLDQAQTCPSFEVPLQVAGRDVLTPALRDGFDPSRPGHVPYRFALARPEEIETALAHAERAATRFATTAPAMRAELLGEIAMRLRGARAALIAAMVLDAGKRVEQADLEVSEAIDFAEYYRRSYLAHAESHHLQLSPRGVVLVTPPWNFPLAIPAGGVLAALMAGNAVILKPALETVLVARRFAELCWDAGVPRDALQLLLCEDELGSRLIRDARVHTVVLTGASATARLFRSLRPALHLLAETGGKNAILVSATADRDVAIKDAVQAAFGHAGQKCSAASLLVCEAEVYDDPSFRTALADAVASLPVGSAWDLRSVVTPLIHPPQGALLRGLTTLEPGESWLVEPRVAADNPRSWSPGVKWDVQPGSFSHQTELFGPVLGVMRCDDLDHGIELVNATPYGLTSGLFSLDEREQTRWSSRVQAGNLYINRGITGAIVQRQPFGGRKASSFGPGAKAGGPNYVLEMCRIAAGQPSREIDAPLPEAATLLSFLKRHVAAEDQEQLARAACLYAHAARHHFAQDHDPSQVLGEANVFRYQPCMPLLLRASADAVLGEALLVCVAALSVGVRPVWSAAPELAQAAPWLARIPLVSFVAEDAEDAAARASQVARIRTLGSLEPELLEATNAAFVHIASDPVLTAGRVELLHYLREQTVSNAFARHGSLHGQRLRI